jgi:hypothetical protein
MRPCPLLAYLTCTECPVRRQCLRESLTPQRLAFSEKGNARRPFYPEGIWGATTTQERRAVRHLPVQEAIDQLDAELPDRARARIDAFAARYPREGGRQSVGANRLWAKLDAMGLGKNGEDSAA